MTNHHAPGRLADIRTYRRHTQHMIAMESSFIQAFHLVEHTIIMLFNDQPMIPLSLLTLWDRELERYDRQTRHGSYASHSNTSLPRRLRVVLDNTIIYHALAVPMRMDTYRRSLRWLRHDIMRIAQSEHGLSQCEWDAWRTVIRQAVRGTRTGLSASHASQ